MNTLRKTNEFIIRPMWREDLNDVLRIEKVSFPSPWPERLFLKELTNPVSDLFVALAPNLGGDHVVGYIVCWLVAGEVHVQNLAAHPQFRRLGIASALLEYALSYYRHRGAQNIYLEVRKYNLTAQQLYSKFHFRSVGVRRRYYSDTGEDAIIMERSIMSGAKE